MKVWESPEGVDGPKNKKGRPFGSGTTTQKKRELRAHKQWSYNPTSPECLVKHLEALEKAKEKCQAKLNEKLQDAIDGVASDGTVSSSRAEKKSLEKDSSAPQQKKQKTKTPGPEVLGKGQPRGFGKVLCQGGQAGQARGKKSCSHPCPWCCRKDLEKSKDLESPLPLPTNHLWWLIGIIPLKLGRMPQAGMPTPSPCWVVILSYVGSKKREKALSQIKSLPQWTLGKLMDCMVCWRKCGVDGKTHIATDLEALAIFDGSKEI